MKHPECILVRVGEIALKSRYVQRRFFDILLNNISSGLKSKKIDYKIKTNLNRIFIYTNNIKKSVKVLKMIFGITSFSPAWTCDSDIKEIKKLAVKIGKYLKLNNKKSFAIRARRSGCHKFTSQEIAVNVGDSVRKSTRAKVDLTNPDYEIFIECRNKKTYIFTDKISGVGGMPLGTAGRVLSIINNRDSVVSSWLLMKRGCELVLIGNRKFMDIIKKWHIGRKIRLYNNKKIREVIKKEGIEAVVVDEKIEKPLLNKIYRKNLLVLRPLIAFDEKRIRELSKTIGKAL